MRITDLPSAWRERLRPASFRGAQFHVEAVARASGRRIVVHEFPKRDLPYSEDMGRRALKFPITGYIITPPGAPVDYTIARDRLIAALEEEGEASLIHPTMGEFKVVCDQYSTTETRERGGMCIFEMLFYEAGLPVDNRVTTGDADLLRQAASGAVNVITQQLDAALKGAR